MAEETQPDYGHKDSVERYFETGVVDLTATTSEYKVVKLRGQAAVIVKALVGNTGNIYVGKKGLSTSTGFELAPGESLKVEYLPDRMPGEFLEIYAVAATAGDDVCYIIVP